LEDSVKISRYFLFACLLLLGQPAGAGAWGTGPFENDDALDWTWELEASADISAIESALKQVTSSGAYVEAPTASAAIAAAEVVAALNGKPHDQLPDEVTKWVESHTNANASELIQLANQVIVRVRDTQHSELAQLWADSPDDFIAWKAELSNLQERLQ